MIWAESICPLQALPTLTVTAPLGAPGGDPGTRMKSCATSGTGGQPSWGQSKGVANTNRTSGTHTALHQALLFGYVNKYITICTHDDLN